MQNTTPNQILVRLRPQRIAFLISENTNVNRLMLVIGFLSRIWGGRYCPIIAVGEKDQEASAKESLLAIRPELIFSLGIDERKWAKFSQEICQPRAFRPLDNVANNLNGYMTDNHEGIIWADFIVQAEINASPEIQRKNLRLIAVGKDCQIDPFIAASFGLISDNLLTAYTDDLNAEMLEIVDEYDTSSYLQLCQEMMKKWSWLDFASYRLQTHHFFGADTIYAPLVVIVSQWEPVKDLALFWNLRMQYGPGSSGRIALFHESEIENTDSVIALTNWLNSIKFKSNYSLLASKCCPKKSLESLARRLRRRLKKLKSQIHHVDIKEPSLGLPQIIPYDHETNVRPPISERVVSIEGLHLTYHDNLPFNAAWMCDLVKDVQTGRAPYELCLLPRQSVFQVLNSPNPPWFRLGMGVLGYGIDSVNIRFSVRDYSISFKVPNDEEILEEILEEADIKIEKDEKRIRYIQAIEMFDGFLEAARFLSGSSLKIVNSFGGNPLTLGEIKSKARLGKAKKKKTSLFVEFSNRLPKHAKRVAQKRYSIYSKELLDIDASEAEILQRLLNRNVIRRKWKLNRCVYCDKEYWIDNLDISGHVSCPGCRKPVNLGDKLQLGYELNELIVLSIREGIIPVVLTARFLSNLTSRGFIFLPGVKCLIGPLKADFDILAICDGHLVAAECKSLENTNNQSNVWKEIEGQLKKSIDLGRTCQIETLIVAGMCEKFPEEFKKNVTDLAGKGMGVLFLNNEDLQKGNRRISSRGRQSRLLRIEDILPSFRRPKKKGRKKKGGRTVALM